MSGFFHFKRLWREQGPLLLLIAFMTLVFILQSILGEAAYSGLMEVPGEVLQAWQAIRAGDFSAGNFKEIGTMLSCVFLHGGGSHLAGNMLFLWIFAALAAGLLGHRWMFATFFFTAVTGSLCHVALNPHELISSLGASGTVTGFEGLYLAMAVRWNLPDPHVWPMSRSIPPSQLAMLGILGLAFDFMGFMGGEPGVAYGAHLGGFIGGMVMGGLVVPKPRVAARRG